MTDSQKRRFEKHVAIKEIDHENRTVSGAVLVPWEVDRQDDWLRPSGVEAMFNPDPDHGVMHAAFPEDAATTEHTILDEPDTIGDEEFPAGTWRADRTYHDEELWSLVEDNVVQGFSIGGTVTREEEYAADELPDQVTFPDGVEEGSATELINGAVEEVSDVDIPAVPRSMFATAKTATEKNLYEDAGGRDDFVDTMQERGHSEEDAGRLYDFLDDVEKLGPAAAVAKFTDTDAMTGTNTSDGQPDDATKWRRFKAWLTADTGPDDGDFDKSLEVSGAAFAKAATVAADVVKEGRPLNSENRERLMAAHDALEAALASDMDHETNRFTDDVRYDFDISAYEEKHGDDYDDKKSKAHRATEKLTEEQADLVMQAVEEFERTQGEAPFGDFREWTWHKHDDWDSDKMFAVNTALDEFRSWTREMHDELPVTDEFVDWLGNEADTEITMTDNDPDGTDSGTEKLEELEKRFEKRIDDLESTIEEKDARIDELEERAEKLSNASADSQQLGGTDGGSEKKKNAIEIEKEVFTG